jgi:mono/diheme cytochrome c family protein
VRGAVAAAALGAAAVLAGCEGSTPSSPSAQRGRQVYLAQCIACHNADPAQPGAVGPPVKGVPREVVEAKVLRGTYPPGYQPRRSTSMMPPQPNVAPDIGALADFLR